MKLKKIVPAALTAFMTLCLALPIWAAGEMVITGSVEIHDIDTRDRIKGVYIETEIGRYVVVDNAKGRELHQYLGRDMEVSGIVTEDEENGKTIDVKQFRRIQDPELN